MKAIREAVVPSLFKMRGRALAHGTLLRKSDAGQALIELALLVPFLLLIFLGTIEFGRLAYILISANSAARAATEYGSQNPATAADTTGMQQAAQQDAPQLSNLTVTSAQEVCQCSSAPGTNVACATVVTSCAARVLIFVQVTTSATYKPLYPYASHPSSLTVTGRATMPVGN